MTLASAIADLVQEVKRVPNLVTAQIAKWNGQVQAKIDHLTSVEKTFYKKESNGFSPIWVGSYDDDAPANLDDISVSGFYECRAANSPTNNWGFVQHFEHRHGNGYGVQIFHSFYHDKTWKRRKKDHTWTKWVEV